MAKIKVTFFESSGDFRQICEFYWDQDETGKFPYTVTEIAETFSISQRNIQQVIVEHCEAYTDGVTCIQCEAPYTFKNRTDYQTRLPRWEWTCQSCIEAERETKIRQEQLANEQLRNIVRHDLSIAYYKNLSIPEMTFKDALYLYTFMRIGLMESFEHIKPYEILHSKLTPTENFNKEVIAHLYDRNLLCIHPESTIDAFTIENGRLTKFDLFRVAWLIPLGDEYSDQITATKAIWEQLEYCFANQEWPDHWQSEWQELQVKITTNECLEYLQFVLQDHDLPFKPGDKTYSMIDQALEKFSVAQMYSLIWRAGKDAAAFYMRGGVTKSHAANTVVGNIQRIVERATINGWEISPYKRNYQLPQTAISEVLFNTILQIGDEGFNSPPK